MKHIASKQSWAMYLAALLLCLGSGCVRSIQPILKDEQVITDDRLLGSWVSAADGNGFGDIKGSGEITTTNDHKAYELAYTDEDGKESDLRVRLGKIGDIIIAESTVDPQQLKALGLGDVYKMHLQPLYSFMVVKQMDPHRLVLKLMDPGWMKAYADDHPNELAVSGDKDSMLVTAKTEDFQAFLLRHAKDDAAFGNDAIFVRPGDPTTRATTAPATSPTTGP